MPKKSLESTKFPFLGSVHILHNQVMEIGGQCPHDDIDNALKRGVEVSTKMTMYYINVQLFFEVDRTNSFFDKLQT